MAKKKKERDYFTEFTNSSWFSAGNDTKNEEQVLEQFEEKFNTVKKKLRGTVTDSEFFKRMKKMWNYMLSGDDLGAKAMIIAGLFYFISPIDLIPDFIPVAGYLDDIAVIGGIWKAVERIITDS